ncbi:uncharacterized protein [Centruroides vittatus]|uniref:uncharacterized protein LOC111631950 n=1 Tax=Centruroides sculpturatus TaxID=218467 RepID=UPI000C6E7982|nr:uncharacterized protein LOC111631950 [Centruroides sculpturatus]
MPALLKSSLMTLAFPGMFIAYKINELKRRHQEQSHRKVTEKELTQLHHKIDVLLTSLEDQIPETALTKEEACVQCITSKATMETHPCGHKVLCRKCLVQSIQTALLQRKLPLRCQVCRVKILRLKNSGRAKGATPRTPLRPLGRSHSAPADTPLCSQAKCVLHRHKVPNAEESSASSKLSPDGPPSSTSSWASITRRQRRRHRRRHSYVRSVSTDLFPIPEREEPDVAETRGTYLH